ncbi:hypothetical protein M8J76_005608 [Diaphorina citri]|nr:hypothetical protein M8J76_005608 [Diaphorina citri]
MAPKKPKDLSLQVFTDEDWARMLKLRGLLVVEIYSSFYGPCIAMQSSLKKMKMVDISSDYLVLVMAQADDIAILERFRNTCDPVWILFGNGKLITTVFGVNPPVLIKLIKDEFANELKVMAGTLKRPDKSLATVTPEEIERARQNEEKDAQLNAVKEEEMNVRLERYRLISLHRLQHLLPHQTIVLYFTNGRSPSGEYPAMTKMTTFYEKLQLSVQTLEDVQLNEEKIRRIFFQSTFEISKALAATLVHCVSSILQYEPTEEEEEPLPLGELEARVAAVVYGPPQLRLPTLWAPLTAIEKCAAMEALYAYKLQSEMDFMLDELPPPQTILVFEAKRSGGIELMLKRNKEILFNYGYFSSGNPADHPRLISKDWATMKKFDRFKMASTKLVVGLLELDDDNLVKFLLTDPIYVSPDGETGSRMAEVFFPPNYDTMQGEIPLTLPDVYSVSDMEEAFNEVQM